MNKIIKNGFYVNINTGECSNELVFDKHHEASFTTEPFHFDNKKTKFTDPLLQKLNVSSTRDRSKYYIFNALNNFMSLLSFSYELNKSLKNQILESNVKNSTDAIILLCKTIYKRNLPITTKELIKAIDTLKNKKIIKKTIGTPYRDYSWYINRLLSKFSFISMEDYQKIHKKILYNYQKLSSILSLHSPAFISTLTYFSMISNFPKRKFNFSMFKTKEVTVIYHRKRLREIGVRYPNQRTNKNIVHRPPFNKSKNISKND